MNLRGLNPSHHGTANLFAPRWRGAALGFTLIELILVMAILTMAVAIAAPALSNFFHGRSLDSEARRLLALTHQGQSRAVSEGLPMDLWLDAQQRQVGLEADPSFSSTDPRAVEYTIETQLDVDAPNSRGPIISSSGFLAATRSDASIQNSTHPNLPRIRFLPDGYISEISPPRLRLTSRDGGVLYLVQNTNRLQYEIRTQPN